MAELTPIVCIVLVQACDNRHTGPTALFCQPFCMHYCNKRSAAMQAASLHEVPA